MSADCVVGDVVCWLPYGPDALGGWCVKYSTHEMPKCVIGRVVSTSGKTVCGLVDSTGVHWDPSISSTWLFKLSPTMTGLWLRHYWGEKPEDDFDKSG